MDGGGRREGREVQMDDYSHMVDFLYLRHAKIRDIHHHHRIRLSETKLMCSSPLTMMSVESHASHCAAVPPRKRSSHRHYYFHKPLVSDNLLIVLRLMLARREMKVREPDSFVVIHRRHNRTADAAMC